MHIQHGSVGGACSAWSTHMLIALAISQSTFGKFMKIWMFRASTISHNGIFCRNWAHNVWKRRGSMTLAQKIELMWCRAVWNVTVWCVVWCVNWSGVIPGVDETWWDIISFKAGKTSWIGYVNVNTACFDKIKLPASKDLPFVMLNPIVMTTEYLPSKSLWFARILLTLGAKLSPVRMMPWNNCTELGIFNNAIMT